VLKIASAFSAKILLSGNIFGEASAKIRKVFFPFFFAILLPKIFEKKIIYKNFSVFSASGKFFLCIFIIGYSHPWLIWTCRANFFGVKIPKFEHFLPLFMLLIS
jgi:hypothetical protein